MLNVCYGATIRLYVTGSCSFMFPKKCSKCDHQCHGKRRSSSSPVTTGGDITQLSKGGWGIGGGRRGGAGSLTPSSFGESLPPAWPEVPHTHGGCVYSEHHCERSAGCCSDARTHRQALRSIRQTPMMRGCSSRSKLTQNQDRPGKRRRFGGFSRRVHAGV